MTVPTETSSSSATGNGVATAFPFSFPIFSAADLKVTVTPSGGTPVVQTLGVQYTVAFTPRDVAGGTVNFLSPVASGAAVLIERDVVFTQPTSLRTQGAYSPLIHEDAFDRIVQQIQELARRLAVVENGNNPNPAVAGNGLVNSSGTWNVGAGQGIQANADDVQVVWAGAPANVTKAAASAGVGTTVARGDHKHDVATAAAVSLTAGGANAEGTSSSLARADHTHAAATGVPVNVTKAAAAAGVATTFAASDHKHDVTTAAPVTIQDSGVSEGTSTSLARADHLHDHGARGGGSLHAVAVSGGAAGFLSGADKAKLDALRRFIYTFTTVDGTANVTLAAHSLQDNKTTFCQVTVAARPADAGTFDCGFRFLATFEMNSGTPTVVGAITTGASHEVTPGTTDCNLLATGAGFVVRGTGSAGTTINWAIYVEEYPSP